MKKTDKPVRLMIDSTTVIPPKNPNGDLGIKCNNCGGYGYTIKLKGGTLPCTQCANTGIKELSKQELQAKVHSLERDLQKFKQALLEDLGFQGMAVPQKIQEAHVQ